MDCWIPSRYLWQNKTAQSNLVIEKGAVGLPGKEWRALGDLLSMVTKKFER